MKQTVANISWNVDSLSDIIGLVLIVGIVALILIAVLNSGGLKVGKLRLGGRRGEPPLVPGSAPSCAVHSGALEAIQSTLSEQTPILRTVLARLNAQDRVLDAQNAGLDILLGQLVGQEINGNVEDAQKAIRNAKAYHDATNDLVAEGAKP